MALVERPVDNEPWNYPQISCEESHVHQARLGQRAAQPARLFRLDYSVYFATLALAACLLYSFIASGDYLLALDLTPEQRAIYAKSGTVLEGFSA